MSYCDITLRTSNGCARMAGRFSSALDDPDHPDAAASGLTATVDGVMLTVSPHGMCGCLIVTFLTLQLPAGMLDALWIRTFKVTATLDGKRLDSMKHPIVIVLPISTMMRRPHLYQGLEVMDGDFVKDRMPGSKGEFAGRRSEQTARVTGSMPTIARGCWARVPDQSCDGVRVTATLNKMGHYALR